MPWLIHGSTSVCVRESSMSLQANYQISRWMSVCDTLRAKYRISHIGKLTWDRSRCRQASLTSTQCSGVLCECTSVCVCRNVQRLHTCNWRLGHLHSDRDLSRGGCDFHIEFLYCLQQYNNKQVCFWWLVSERSGVPNEMSSASNHTWASWRAPCHTPPDGLARLLTGIYAKILISFCGELNIYMDRNSRGSKTERDNLKETTHQ